MVPTKNVRIKGGKRQAKRPANELLTTINQRFRSGQFVGRLSCESGGVTCSNMFDRQEGDRRQSAGTLEKTNQCEISPAIIGDRLSSMRQEGGLVRGTNENIICSA